MALGEIYGGMADIAVVVAVVRDGAAIRNELHRLLRIFAALGDGERAGDECDGLELIVYSIARGVRDGHNGDPVIVLRAVRNILHRADDRCRQREATGRQLLALARVHGVGLAVVENGVAAVGMFLAVILPRMAVRRDGDDLLVLRDGQRAVHIGDVVVLGLRFAVQLVAGDLVGAAADVRLAALDRHSLETLAIHERLLAGDGVAAVGQRRTVVLLAGALRRQLDLHRVDSQLAVHTVAEGIVARNVCAAARDLIALDNVLSLVAHVRGAALHDCRQSVAREQHVLGVGVARVRQRRAVIRPAGTVGGDGDRRGDWRDLQQTVFHDDKLYRREVLRVVVHEAVLRETHVVLADIRAGRFRLRSDGKAEIVFGVRAVADADDLVAVHFVLAAIVDHAVAVALDLHDHGIRRDDLEIAVSVGDLIVLGHVVVASIHDARVVFVRHQNAGVLAHRGPAAGDDRFHTVTVGQIGNGVARAGLDLAVGGQAHAVRLAVIDDGVVRSFQNDLLFARAALGDLQRTGNERDGLELTLYIIAGRFVFDGHRGDNVIVVRAVRNVRYGAFDRRRQNVAGRQLLALARVHGVGLAVVENGVAAVGMFLAVILPRMAVRRDGDDLLVLRDGQRAVHIGDVVVLGLRFAVQLVAGDLVGAAADVRLAALDRHSLETLAIHERLLAGDGVAAVGQRRTVVLLAGALRRQLDLHRVDSQLAVHTVAEGIVARNVCAAARDLIALDNVLSLVAHVRGAALHDCRQSVAREQHVLGVGVARVRQRRAVIRPAGTVGGDGDRRGDWRDLDPAVLHLELYRREVLRVVVHEAVLREAHVVLADIRAGRFRLYAVGKAEVRRGVRAVADADDLVAGHGLRFAVVDLGRGVARDGDGHFVGVLRDRQRAVLILRHIIAGESVAAEFDGALIDDVIHAADVGDGALRRHGEGELLFRIHRDNADRGEFRLRERLAVVGSARILRRDRQRNGVVNGDNVPRRLHFQRLAGGVAIHMCRRIFRTQRGRGARRQRIADRHGAGLVGSDLHFRTLEVMVNGVLRGIALEVQLQRQTAVRRHGAGFDVVLIGRIVHVRGRAVCLVRGIDGNGAARRAGAGIGFLELVGAVGLLAPEFDLIGGILVRFPHGVEDVVPVAVHAGSAAVQTVFRAGGRRAGAPADEGIAGAGESAAVPDIHQTVIGDLLFDVIRAGAAVGLIGQGNDHVLAAPHGVKRDIAGDLDLVVGLVFDGAAFALRPAEEHLAFGSGEAERFDAHGVGRRIDGVFPVVFSRLRAANIGHGAFALVGEVRIERDVIVDLGIEVERGAVVGIGRPAGEHPVNIIVIRVRQREVIKLLGVDGLAVTDRERLTDLRARHVNIYRAVVFGRHPLCIKVQAAERHLLVCKVELRAGAGAVFVPAGKHVVIRHTVRSGRDIVLIAQALRVIQGNGFHWRCIVAVIEAQVVAVYLVIQGKGVLGKALLIVSEPCCAGIVPGIALDIVVFFVVSSVVEIRRYGFQQCEVGGA